MQNIVWKQGRSNDAVSSKRPALKRSIWCLMRFRAHSDYQHNQKGQEWRQGTDRSRVHAKVPGTLPQPSSILGCSARHEREDNCSIPVNFVGKVFCVPQTAGLNQPSPTPPHPEISPQISLLPLSASVDLARRSTNAPNPASSATFPFFSHPISHNRPPRPPSLALLVCGWFD